MHIYMGFVCASKQTSTIAQKQTAEFDGLSDYSDGPWHVVDPG